jgi:hypothetical protein
MPNSPSPTPESVVTLQAAYGLPSQAGFGSAVFYDRVEPADDLEQVALKHYRYFLGDLWDRFGEAAWMAPWKQIYRRKANSERDIVTELRSLTDTDASLSVPMLLDNIEDADAAQKALSVVYDDANITDLAIYTVGDGEAMSGILIAGRCRTVDAIFLIFLMD